MFNFSENIQRSILNLCKFDESFYSQIINLIKQEYFEYPIHSKIYSIIQDYFEKYNKLPNDEFILEECKGDLRKNENLDDFKDEIEIINNLDIDYLSNKEYYLDKIESFAKGEALKEAIKNGIKYIQEGKPEKIEKDIRKALSISRVIDIGEDYFEEYKDRWTNHFNKKRVEVQKTLFPSLNRALDGGLGKEELGLVVANSGGGKSLFLVNQAVVALTENKNVLYISLEMSEEKIAKRFDSVITCVSQSRIESSVVEVTNKINKFKDTFKGKLIIKKYPAFEININSIRAYLHQLKNTKDFIPDLIIIDYLELLSPVVTGNAEYLSQQRVAYELASLVAQTKTTLWTATQANREGLKVPVLTDAHLGDSYGKIKPFDVSFSLNQTVEEYNSGRMRGYIIKARDGQCRFIMPLEVNYNTLQIKEVLQKANNLENVIAKLEE